MGLREIDSGFFDLEGCKRTSYARQYLSGFLGDFRRKNIERIGEEVAEVDYQSVHNFVSESQWDYPALVDQVAKDANTLLGGNKESMLLLDETSFLKKGTHSVGVTQPYLSAQGRSRMVKSRYWEPSAAARMSPWSIIACICPRAGLTNGRRFVISCDKTRAIKYSLSNAQASAQQLCYRQHQRYWIEPASLSKIIKV